MPPDTRTLLERQAALARAREAEARAEAEALEAAIARLTAARDALEALEHRGEPLTRDKSVRHNSSNMPSAPVAIGTLQPRRGRPSESKHPFSVALSKRASSLSAWAEAHGLDYGKVKGWVSETSPRRIPREWAEKIEDEFRDPKTKKSSVPATLTTWTQGIR